MNGDLMKEMRCSILCNKLVPHLPKLVKNIPTSVFGEGMGPWNSQRPRGAGERSMVFPFSDASKEALSGFTMMDNAILGRVYLFLPFVARVVGYPPARQSV